MGEVVATIAVGGNLGDAAATVAQALVALADLSQSRVLQVSGLYRSPPFLSDGPDYVNAVAQVATAMTAPALLHALQHMELAAGRERPYHWAPRTLDLDLIFYGQASIDSATLTVPHPRWQERAFVVVPLAEVAPQRVWPALLAAVASQPLTRITVPTAL